MKQPTRVLVLYWYPVPLEKMRLAIKQHLQVFESDKTNIQAYYHNVYRNTKRLRNLNYDAVILHTTFLCMRWSELFYRLKWELRWIKEIDCLKIAIPQDEYDHSEILDEWLYEWGVNAVFSCFDEKTCQIIYPIMFNKARFYPALTGYINENTVKQLNSKLPTLENRPNDIVYRASQLPYWFGSHGQLKHELAHIIAKPAQSHSLTIDISTNDADTIVGEAWLDFLASGRTVIGCESGSSVLDRRGEIRAHIQALLQDNPSMSFNEVSSQLPAEWDNYSFFAISPRHLEGVITKTCQVLVEGTYNGILLPYKHYIPIKRDFSNINQILEEIKNIELLQDITEQAYKDIVMSGNYTYQRFAQQLEKAISYK
jgi:hypothetical protein